MTDEATASVAVLDFVRALVAFPAFDEDELVLYLEVEKCYSRICAEKLNALVPSAFAWVKLQKLWLRSFPSFYIALSVEGQEVQLPVMREPYFRAALVIAHAALRRGGSESLSQEDFEAVVWRSAEMKAANLLLLDHQSLADATLQPLRVYRFSAEDARVVL